MRLVATSSLGTILVLVLFVAFSPLVQLLHARMDEQSKEPSSSCWEAETDLPVLSKWFRFSLGDNDFEILPNGRAKRLHEKRSTDFLVPLPENDVIEHVYYCAHQGDIIIVYQIRGGDSGAGLVTRLDGTTLNVKWLADIYGFNVGEPLIARNAAYVTSIGFVGKVDLQSGKYHWKHKGLYRRSGTYNAFHRPKLERKRVLFPEKRWKGPPGTSKTLVVDDQSGEILKGALRNETP